MQLRTSKTIEFFEETFRKKFNFSKYVSLDIPTIFFGFYNNSDKKAIQEHKGVKIAWFAGSDSLMIRDVSFLEGSVVIADSDWVSQDLDKL